MLLLDTVGRERLGVREMEWERSAAQRTPTVLATKLRAPRPPLDALARPRLTRALRDGASRRLTLLAAPAGFGKTTALAAWGADGSDARPFAWVTLDEGDGDPAVLWAHTLAALRAAAPATLDGADERLAGPRPDIGGALAELVNGLVGARPVVLVLDDAHRLDGSAAVASIAWLVEHGPRELQIVLSARAEPALPLAALRARGELTELGVDDLRLTDAEGATFLARRGDGDGHGELRPDELRTLMARTEGWPGALRLAAAALDGPGDRASVVAGFGGTSRRVADYLREEVLSAHTPAERATLRRLALVERLSGPLCDTLLDRDGSSALLEDLIRRELLVRPLDDRREWYRLHPLLRDVLRAELEEAHPEELPELHARAGAWYRDRQLVGEAVRHLAAAGDHLTASELIAAHWFRAGESGGPEVVQGWLALIPPETARGCARLLLVQAWLAAMSGRREWAARTLRDARALADRAEGPLPDGMSSVESSLNLLQATFPWGRAVSAARSARRAVELEGDDSPWRPVSCFALGRALLHLDALDESAVWGREGLELAQRWEQHEIVAACFALLSRIEGLHDRRDEQLRLAELADAASAAATVRAGGPYVDTAAGLALDAHDRTAEALVRLERAVRAGKHAGQPLDVLDGLVALAAVRLRARDLDGAQVGLAEAEATLEACPEPGALARRVDELRGRVREAQTGLPVPQDLSERERTVLRLLDSGRSEREIADALYVSFNTVHTHVKAIYRKLGVSSRADAVRLARVQEARPPLGESAP